MLTIETKLQLERRVRETRDKHEYTRLCVVLNRDEGMSIELIAQTLHISVSCVYRYLSEYEKQSPNGV